MKLTTMFKSPSRRSLVCAKTRPRLLAVSVVAFFCVVGCDWAGGSERRWTEDVKLDDGSIIKIERMVSFSESDALGGGVYNLVESDASLKFSGDLASLPVWRFPWKALVLYRNDDPGRWTIVATTTSCEVWLRNGRPIPMYWQFELFEDGWREVPLSKSSIGKKTNLFFDYESKNVPKHLSVPGKQFSFSNPRTSKKYLEVVPSPPKGCVNMR